MNEDHGTGSSDNLPPFEPAQLPKPFSSLIDVDLFALSHTGHVRTKNEDHYLVVRGGRGIETVLSNLSESQPGDLYEETAYAMVVADGVGGEAVVTWAWPIQILAVGLANSSCRISATGICNRMRNHGC